MCCNQTAHEQYAQHWCQKVQSSLFRCKSVMQHTDISYTTQTSGGATCYSHRVVWKHVTLPRKTIEKSKHNYKKQHFLNLDIGKNYHIWIIYSSQAIKVNSTLLRGQTNFWLLWKAQELQFPCKADEILVSKYFGSWIWSSSKFSMERLVFGFRH